MRGQIFVNFTELSLCAKILFTNNDPASFPDVHVNYNFRKYLFTKITITMQPFAKIFDCEINPLYGIKQKPCTKV